MELNREQIIKALECCAKDNCDKCPNSFGNCYANLAGYALALIRELTEEKERIAHESACHRQTVIDNLRESLEFLDEETERVRADTVRKFAEMLKKRIEKSSYNARTDRKTVRKEELLEQVNWVYHEVVPDLIDQIAQEILKEG